MKKKKETKEEISEESNDNKQKSSESELEKEIEETESQEANEVLEETSEEIINDNEFREFIQPSTESFAPVLERVEVPQQESLEQDVASISTATQIEQEPIDYTSAISRAPTTDEERIKYQTNIEPPILKPIEISENLPRQELLEPTTGIEINPQNMMSQKMVDTEFIEEKTRLPFEKDDKKYKEFRL